MRVLALVVAALSLSACGTPAFTSAMRTSFSPEVSVEASCLSAGREGDDLDAKVKDMYRQGYRLIYVSEYTSSARFGYPTTVCFERAAQRKTASN